MADNFYNVERATTGRASCKDTSCKENIKQGELRIAKNCKNPFGDGSDFKKDWFHAACIFSALKRARATTKKIESVDDLQGFEDLSKEDQKTIKELVANRESAGGKSKAKPKKAAGKKRKADDDDDDEDEDEKPKKKAKKAKKAASDDDEDEGSDDDKPKKKAKKPAKKAKKGSDDDEDEGSDDEKKKPKKKAAAKKKASGGDDDGEFTRYEMDEKFWEIKKDGTDVTVRYGKIGKNGQTNTKSYPNEEKAQKEYDKVVREKTGKGYEQV